MAPSVAKKENNIEIPFVSGSAPIADDSLVSASALPPMPPIQHELSEAMRSIKPGIALLPLSAQKMPQAMRDQYMKDLDSLKKTGSLSGGVITHEFARADDLITNLLNKGISNIQYDLAIIPTNLPLLLGPEFALIGADTQAKYIENYGWTGYFQILKNKKTNQMIELSEDQYDVLNGDGAQGTSDFINSKILDYPAVFQSIKNGMDIIYDCDWFVGTRQFKLSTKNFSPQEMTTVAQNITLAYLAMPNKGWKKPIPVLSPRGPFFQASEP